jgi:nucleobase:cation symporter-1, NCS1 family
LPHVEAYGVEPIPAELRTVGWRDLFAINFTFFLNPVMYVLGALAVTAGGLPLWWAVAAMAVGQALAFTLLLSIAEVGVDHGLPGQVALRATLGFWGARLLSSPYRVVAATYWFAAQALTSAYGFQAIVQTMSGHRLPLVPVAIGLAFAHAALALLGFDVMRYVLRVVLPLSLALTGVLLALYLASDDPRFAVHRVFRSPDQHLTWAGFATYVTVMCGASLTLVTNVADVCRYTRSRRDMRIALLGSAVTSATVTTFIGGYAAAATGASNPFVAVAGLTKADAVLILVLVAIVVQSLAANVTNVYTAGLSLVNSAPTLGRLRASVFVAGAAIALSGFPDFVDHAQKWIVHLGNVAAPLTGVILADYLLVRRRHVDVAALYEPHGRYRFLGGVNLAAVAATAVAVGAYYALPHAWVKVAWGVLIGAVAYVALETVQRAVIGRARASVETRVQWAE